MRVLLVEDDENLGKIVARDLAGRGHVATVATTGAQALEAASGGHFDVAILDWVLPDRDGISVLRRGGRDGPIDVGHAVVDPHRQTITVGEASEKLTDREAALLRELLRHAGEPLSRSHLIEAVWRGEPVNPNVVDVYVGYLRAKLDNLPGTGLSIASVRRVGFRLDVAP